MSAHSPLPMYEEVLLLALDDDKGTTEFGAMYTNGMGGAILAELVSLQAVKIADDRKKTVTAVAGAVVSDPILGEAFQLIQGAKKPKKAGDWVMKFSGLKDLKDRTARQLVAKGVLSEETGTILKIFKRTIFPEADGGPERALIARMEAAIFSDTPNVDQRTVIIIALAEATSLLSGAIDKKRLKQRKERVKQLANGEVVGEATKEAVAAIQAAIMVATMVPIMAAATSATN